MGRIAVEKSLEGRVIPEKRRSTRSRTTPTRRSSLHEEKAVSARVGMKALIRLAPAGARSGALTCSRNNVPTSGDDAVGTMTRNGSLLVRLS